MLNILYNVGCRAIGLHFAGIFMSAYLVVPLNTGIRVPPCGALMRPQAFDVNVFSSGTGTDTFYLYEHFKRHFQCSNAKLPRNVNPRNGYSLIQQQCFKSL